MISDNYVTGDNIYLRELQNFFFEVLGMMSITHYGAIGDGRRDNYGPIQVAIDDANRRGLSFLYVPYGKFIYTGEFTNLIDPDTGKQKIIFMGNPHSHIVNIRTGEEIEIHQFGWCSGHGGDSYTKEETNLLVQGNYSNMITQGSYIDLSGEIGSVVDLTPIPGTNTAYYMEMLNPGEGFEVVGDFTYATVNLSDHTMAFKFADVAPTYDDRWDAFVINTPKIAVFSFQNTDTIQPAIYKIDNYVVRSGDTMTGSLSIGDTNTVGDELGLTIGTNNAASGGRSFAQGNENVASGYNTFASGVGCNATGNNSHAEGQDTTASGTAAHAEGGNATASGGQSHCEGWNNAATYLSSHAEGTGVRSVSQSSHAEGFATVARGRAQHAEGQYNIIDTTTDENTATRGAYIHIAGNGADDGSYRSNAHTLDWSGNAWFSGEVYVGSTSGTNKDAGSKKLISEADLQAFATLNGLQMPS